MMTVFYASSKYAALQDRAGWVQLVRSDGEEKWLGGHSSDDVIRTVGAFADLTGTISDAGIVALDLFLDGFYR